MSGLFMIPCSNGTLRVEGSARIVFDVGVLEFDAVDGRQPPAALVVTVTKAYAHCGKKMIRSRLWDPSRHVECGALPSLGQMIKDQADMTLAMWPGRW